MVPSLKDYLIDKRQLVVLVRRYYLSPCGLFIQTEIWSGGDLLYSSSVKTCMALFVVKIKKKEKTQVHFVFNN